MSEPRRADPKQRQAWMSALAKASSTHLDQLVEKLGNLPPYIFLRPPEIGLTMVRGRAGGGNGQVFNLGEIPLTRCVVQITLSASQTLAGFGYVAGRSHRHAELAAVCDALLQHPDWFSQVYKTVITPLQTVHQQAKDQQAQQVEATRVNFFTLQRGES
jgi:alpha-D-ribose 1-methylphosphonate 5-triphosphate synthase subunit PhnG